MANIKDNFTNQTTECGKCTALLRTRKEISKGTDGRWRRSWGQDKRGQGIRVQGHGQVRNSGGSSEGDGRTQNATRFVAGRECVCGQTGVEDHTWAHGHVQPGWWWMVWIRRKCELNQSIATLDHSTYYTLYYQIDRGCMVMLPNSKLGFTQVACFMPHTVYSNGRHSECQN